MQRHEGGYYIRLTVRDLPGTAAAVATRMAEQNISLEASCSATPMASTPHGAAKRPPVPLVLITYAATEGAIRALDASATR